MNAVDWAIVAGYGAIFPDHHFTVEDTVAEGDRVSVGQPLMVIESMKLETTLLAPREARVKAVHFGVGATFRLKAILLTLTDA